MATNACLFLCAIFSATCAVGFGETVLGEVNDEFDFDGLPGAQHEFKIEVGAGQEECFYQKIVAGGKIHVSYEVIKGGDTTIDLYMRHLSTRELAAEARTRHSWDGEVVCRLTGVYAICLDNTFSRMASKLVYVYLVTYVEQEWAQYHQEIEEVKLTVANFTQSIQTVQESIKDAMLQQAHSRMNVIRDWYMVSGNNMYIQTWSIVQCVVIVLSAGIQTVFVRRLFKYTNVTPTSKPRA